MTEQPSNWARGGYAHRVVIDTYPTPDGKPFDQQDPHVWEQVGEPDAPHWLPGAGAMSPWHYSGTDDLGAYEQGYTCPNLTRITSRTLDRGTVARRLARVLALGCQAHVERAPLGPAQRCEITPAQLPPQQLGDGLPKPPHPDNDEPPF